MLPKETRCQKIMFTLLPGFVGDACRVCRQSRWRGGRARRHPTGTVVGQEEGALVCLQHLKSGKVARVSIRPQSQATVVLDGTGNNTGNRGQETTQETDGSTHGRGVVEVAGGGAGVFQGVFHGRGEGEVRHGFLDVHVCQGSNVE